MTEQLSEISAAEPRFAAFTARLLRGSRLYFESANGVELPPRSRGRRCWIVSRGLCRFFRVSLLPDADRARQIEAITLETRRLSPFAQTGSHFHLGTNFAGLWLWDQQATQAAATGAGIDAARLRVLPETALRPVMADGVRLIECLDGVEGQFWSDGSLAASRWWPRRPDARAWMLFQRGASVPPEQLGTLVPVPLRLGWLDRAWTRTRLTRGLDLARLDPRLVAAVLAVAILAVYGYQGAQYLRVRDNAASLAHEVEARSAAIDPILTARTHALDNLAAIRRLHGLAPYPSQLTLMARVAEILPQDKSRLDDWLYDRGELELSIADDQPIDVVHLVRALEESGYFRGVAADRTGNNNTVRLRAAVLAR